MTVDGELQQIQDYLDTQCSDNPEEMAERIRTISVYLSRSGKIWADCKRILRKRTSSEINSTIIMIAKEHCLSAKVQNALVDAICDDDAYLVDWSERVTKSCTHQIDALRSLLSWEKEQLRLSPNQ